MFKNSNVLITGGAGFIGSYIAKELHALGANVTVIDSMTPSYGGNLFNLDGFIDEIPHCLKKSITSIKIWLSIIFSSLSS